MPHRPVALGHHALRYDASEHEMTKALVADMAQCDVLDVTEVGSHQALKVLQGVAHIHGWMLHAPGDRAQHETAVLWNPAVVTCEHRDTFQPTKRRLNLHRKGELWVHALLFSLVAHPAAKFWGVFGHAPAHVRGPKGFRQGARWVVSIIVYHLYFHGVRKRMKGRTPRAYGFDFNLDWRRGWVRKWTAARFPRMKCGWPTKPLPEDGTHHRSIIDWHLLYGLLIVEPTRRLKKRKGLDHCGIVTVVGVPDPAA